MNALRPVLFVGLALLAQSGHSQGSAGDVALQVVKYDGLKQAIAKNRGKVVLVDFWGDFCLPCKKGFPKVVDMHKKHAPQGLAVISVSLDPLGDGSVKEDVLRFLQAKGASFTNLLLDEPSGFWQDKLRFTGPPCLFVFDRQGKWTQFQVKAGKQGMDYAAIEKKIVEALAEK